MITHEQFELDKTRLTLYFDQYTYKVSLYIDDIQAFRGVKNPDEYYLRCQHCFIDLIDSTQVRQYYIVTNRTPYLTKFVEWRISSDQSAYMVRYHHNRVDLYFNDLSMIQNMLDVYTEDEIETIQINYQYATKMSGYEKGVVYQQNPKYKYRIYIKSRLYTGVERAEIRQYLQSKNIKISSAFNNWLTYDRLSRYGGPMYGNWAFSNYSFDFNDDTLITSLCLRFTNFVGKVCEIQKKINT